MQAIVFNFEIFVKLEFSLLKFVTNKKRMVDEKSPAALPIFVEKLVDYKKDNSRRDTSTKEIELLMSKHRDRRNSHILLRLVPASNYTDSLRTTVTESSLATSATASSTSVSTLVQQKPARMHRTPLTTIYTDSSVYCKKNPKLI